MKLAEWQALRELVWERDKGICQLCGQPIDRTVKREFHADHIQQRYEGGADILNNLRASHWRCNSRRRRKNRHHYPEGTSPYAGSVALRLPPALKRKLVAQAKREHRSLNSQIIYLLEQATVDESDPGPGREQAEERSR